jgi:hypothetical protein
MGETYLGNHCTHEGEAVVHRTAAHTHGPDVNAASTLASERRDPWLAHLARFTALYTAVTVSNVAFLLGLVWLAHLMDRTGRRKRDLLLVLVPGCGVVVTIQTMWRAVARTAYWEPRPDRPSAPLHGAARRTVIVAGGILTLILAVAAVVAVAGVRDERSSWTEREQTELFGALVDAEVDPTAIPCIADYIVSRYPEGPASLPHDPEAVVDLGIDADANC